ncbi:MAG: hypothetical protein ACRCTD_06740 [Beijerinckiaceae bacterium]
MKLSKDAVEALLVLGAFAIIAGAAWLVLQIWPIFPYGNWRVFLTLIIGTLIAIPTVLRLRKRLLASSEDKSDDN